MLFADYPGEAEALDRVLQGAADTSPDAPAMKRKATAKKK
jgi:hypothetical protein